MIGFFRRIRKKMADDNKPMKYMRYAVGEILLVMVGILLALQVNNFNNNRQQRKIEQGYLLSLQNEFNTNLNKIDSSIKENTKQINSIEVMLTLFDNNVRDTISDKRISDIIHSIFGSGTSFFPSRGVLTDIISSGNLNLIQNEQLRQHLASFESSLEFLNTQITGSEYAKNKMKNLLEKNGSILKILMDKGLNFEHKSISNTINNRQLFSSIEFENILLDYYLTKKATNGARFFGAIKEQIEQILVEVDSQLIK